MNRVNRDSIIAILLLVMCGTFFVASFDIRVPDYGTLPPTAWPRAILTFLSILSAIYLVQSIKNPPESMKTTGGLKGLISEFKNPIWCFALYLAFLITLPVLGMLIGGILFVFCMLTVLSGAGRSKHLLHSVIAVVSVGLMWSLFTYALNVMLPEGMLISFS
ncbi:MAG: tripartite tricarboxylate transporter TctB family protein [Gammaproteobacteria bacterium]